VFAAKAIELRDEQDIEFISPGAFHQVEEPRPVLPAEFLALQDTATRGFLDDFHELEIGSASVFANCVALCVDTYASLCLAGRRDPEIGDGTGAG
jgi:hypothetical protein